MHKDVHTLRFFYFAQSTINSAKSHSRASVAQGIEHSSPKAGVGRSNRPGGTITVLANPRYIP